MEKTGGDGETGNENDGPRPTLPIVDLTVNGGSPDAPFVICKIPQDIYDKVLKIVNKREKKPPIPPPPKRKRKKPYKIKGTWTKEEDSHLISLVSKYGAKKWPSIAEHMDGRNGKQCRERFLNHLDKTINHGEWAEDEDELIIRLHEEYGNQWAKMSRRLEGRPANMIKNRWNSTLYKLVATRKGIEVKKPSRKRKKKKKKKKDEKRKPATRSSKKRSDSRRRRRRDDDDYVEDDDDEEINDELTRSFGGDEYDEEGSPRMLRLDARKSPDDHDDGFLNLVDDDSHHSVLQKSFCYPVPSDYQFPNNFNQMFKFPDKRSSPGFNPLEPPTKRPKMEPTTPNPFTSLLLSMDDDATEIENPFPSPRTLDSARKGEQEDVYKQLILQNRKINQSQVDSFGDTSLDEKLGLGSGIQELKEGEKDLERKGYQRNSSFRSLNLNLEDSAVFASDYGINLGSPAHLSLELWSPRYSDQQHKTPTKDTKNYLKINVHPLNM